MNRTQKLEGVKSLSSLKYEVIQMEMAKLKEREATLRDTLRQLAASKRQEATLRQPDDSALIAGAGIRWQQWVDQRRASVNMELAQTLAQKESCIARMKLAFSRNEAAKGLVELARQKDKVKKQRRSFE
ncbi:hypothetical protein [Yoonia sediminilitoris]|uniref:Flagellar export protein FliJ n=1 Tax=Yoonia sediminilitoris TaxID=1286148 RepID=A0A2T6KN38_9RHOB|nr:hypothetical protein [Yoonia sediminilitoris]PUB17619.1 hypothetical protein C8N45_102632 [Yoonia sediminilitoris]RCW97914.1 hypothetical protein DFP92_102632 [Yoonia sediminilitoris]